MIGSVLLLPDVLDSVAAIVSVEDFYDHACQRVFDCLLRLHEAGRAIDDTLLVSALKASGDWGPMGGAACLAKMVNGVCNAAHAVYYAEIVREKSQLRKMIMACTLALRDSYDEVPSEDVAAGLESRLAGTAASDVAQALPIANVWDRVIADLRRSVGRADPPALLSGLPSLDHVGFVFAPGEITILAARPGVGKTSLATQIAMHHAGRGRPVLFVSLEMRDDALASRVLFARAGLNHQSVRTRGVSAADVDQVQQARDALGDALPLFVWAPGRVRVGAIRALASAVHAKHGLRLLVVDYTSWILADDARQQMRDQVGEKVKALRSLGQRLGVPVLLLHQLNREGAGEKPQLKHLRDSGCVEEDADIVAFIHPVEAQPPQVSLIVAKSRQGARGEVPLLWHAAQTQFADLDTAPVEDRGNYEPDFATWNQREFA